METQVFVVKPCHGCPFNVEALRFVPTESYDDGLTLVLFHALNLHKETFTLLVAHLLENVSPVRIKDVWAIDNPNQGRSARLNRELLESNEYREKWSAAEYARAAYAFLTSTSHDVDFRRRKLVGVAHSGGATGLMLLTKTHPEIAFQALILMDPGLLDPIRQSSVKLAALFRKIALSKPDSWSSIGEARKEMGKGAYRTFQPSAFDSYMECGFLPVGSTERVVLACSKLQEAAYYASEDIIKPPSEVLISLQKEDKLPVHLIVCLKDEYKGLSDDMKSFQLVTVGKMNCGSVQLIEKGGHMFPQVEPALAALHVRNALMKIDDRGARL